MSVKTVFYCAISLYGIKSFNAVTIRVMQLLFLFCFAGPLAACPVGLSPVVLPFGADGCRDGSGLRWIEGALSRCPAGMDRTVDDAGRSLVHSRLVW